MSRLEHQRPALAPMRAQSDRNHADRVLAPMAWQVTGYPVDSEVRFGKFGTIALAMSEDGSSPALAQVNAVRSFVVVGATRQVFGEMRVEGRSLRWIKRNQVSCALWPTAAMSESEDWVKASTIVKDKNPHSIR